MIPLSDSIKSRHFPLATILILALNIYIFYQQLISPDIEAFVMQWGFVPAQLALLDTTTWLPILTSMFLHGGFVHIISNMLFLWVFADNIEDSMGFFGFLIFYLLCGLVAALAQYAVNPASTIPMIGASGAVAGVLGAYWRLYPHSTIHTLIPIGFFITSADIPASLMIGFWFLTQIFSGYASLSVQTLSDVGGVAFFAHIGGFLAGLILVNIFARKKNSRVETLRRLW